MSDKTTFSDYLRSIVPGRYTYTNVSDFIDRKGKFYDKKIGDIQNELITDVFDVDTCSVSALRNYWGKLYNVPPVVKSKDGTSHVLTDDEFRISVKTAAFKSCWDGTTYQLNAFITKLFQKRGGVFASDKGGMDITYVFFFELPDWELKLYRDYDILPRNAGCGHTITYVSSEVFGFYGSGLYPFNQRPFMNYR